MSIRNKINRVIKAGLFTTAVLTSGILGYRDHNIAEAELARIRTGTKIEIPTAHTHNSEKDFEATRTESETARRIREFNQRYESQTEESKAEESRKIIQDYLQRSELARSRNSQGNLEARVFAEEQTISPQTEYRQPQRTERVVEAERTPIPQKIAINPTYTWNGGIEDQINLNKVLYKLAREKEFSYLSNPKVRADAISGAYAESSLKTDLMTVNDSEFSVGLWQLPGNPEMLYSMRGQTLRTLEKDPETERYFMGETKVEELIRDAGWMERMKKRYENHRDLYNRGVDYNPKDPEENAKVYLRKARIELQSRGFDVERDFLISAAIHQGYGSNFQNSGSYRKAEDFRQQMKITSKL